MICFRKTVFFLLFFIFNFSQSSLAQTNFESDHIFLHCKNQSLRSVLKDLSVQSNANFVFRDELVEGKNITCQLSDVSIEIAFIQIMSQTDLSFKKFTDGSFVLFREEKPVENTPKKEVLNNDFQPPVVKNEPKPFYPPFAEKHGLEGYVNIDLLVDENGEVKLSKVTKSSGNIILDRAAIQYVHKLKFHPALKEGKPTMVWVSWGVNYKSPETDFFQSDYIYKVNNYYRLAKQNSGERKKEILQKILQTHKDCIDYFIEKPNIDYNEIIKEVILNETYIQWKDLWKDISLHFLVFHDFVIRFEGTDEAYSALTDLKFYVKKDIDFLICNPSESVKEQKRKYYLITSIREFLKNEYPQIITEDLEQQISRNF